MKEVLNEILSPTTRMRLMIAAIVVAFLVGITASYFVKGEDGPIETLAEKFIETETGVKVDFDELLGNEEQK